MQELVREYLNELGKKQKKHRRFRIVTAVFAVMVVAGVIWGLSRAGIATKVWKGRASAYGRMLQRRFELRSGRKRRTPAYGDVLSGRICIGLWAGRK